MNVPEDRLPEETKSRGVPLVECTSCGANNNAFATKCWICHISFTEQTQETETVGGEKPDFADGMGPIFGNTLLVILLLALVLVGIGVFRINSTWFVYYVVFITLPLLAAAVGLRHALHSKNQDIRTAGAILTSIYATLLTILGTAAVVIASVVALIISFFVALGQICSDLLNSGN